MNSSKVGRGRQQSHVFFPPGHALSWTKEHICAVGCGWWNDRGQVGLPCMACIAGGQFALQGVSLKHGQLTGARYGVC